MPRLLPSVVALLTLLPIDQRAQSEQRLTPAIPVEAGNAGADAKVVAPTPAGISAKAWAIIDGKTGKPLWSFHDAEARPIASTTKIMTAWIILQRADKNPKLLDEEIRFSERAAAVGGSSCRLKIGERLPVRELLYGLLLPSGNDAAVALAEHFGPRLQSGEPAKEDGVRLFVAEMNRQAKSLKLGETKFLDPNGLARNQASARDLAVLTWHAMQNSRFREYVKTRVHEYEVRADADTKRRVTWKNTNRLLEDASCDGVKTGTTRAAGACLVASAHQGADRLIVVVLGSTSGDGRYEDAHKLLGWAWEQRGGKIEKPKETKKGQPRS
ncbi:MAG TPA: D-alanyl-D-alanine carboxypeptidase family protein [Gemmataceae bacterium]|nr:D-alanyl-D-alanine carboxypeptidase family protein [Gemmataceae bacterium]